MLKRIAVTQLELLKWARVRGAKGFTVKDASQKFKSTLQATSVRLEDAFERGWLRHSWEDGDGGGQRSRYAISHDGTKILAMKWIGRGRFRVIEKVKASGKRKAA